ncbi:MAG TPA: ABC transporter substrate-binding protein [Thermoanaerobaculia bacterium]|nr:ABC transporter substrate-binding protein [Thermoanaerobaculia bacterium]
MKNRTLQRDIPLLVLSLVLIASIAAACGRREAPGGTASGDAQALIIPFSSTPTNLDVRIGNDNASGRIYDLIYSGLVRLTPESDYAPDVAERWETPDDRTIIFHLNRNARFHNGQPVTSADVKFTYDSLMDEAFDSPKKAGYDAVDRIEAPDPHTVVFRLKEPNGGLFANLTLGILPRGADPEVYRSKPIGAGPYRVVEFRPDDRLVMEAFDDWHLGKPKVRRVIARIIPDATTRVLELRKGSVNFEINAIPNDSIPQFEQSNEFKVVREPGAIYQYLAFNLHDPILRNRTVRQAIAHAIDRERIVRDLQRGYGVVTETMLPESHWAHASGLPSYSHDPERAKMLLDQAGHRDPDGDGPRSRFKLSFKTSTDAEANQRAQMIQQMLNQVGIEVEINSSEFGTFYEEIQQGRFQLFSLSRAGVVDPDFYHVIFHSSSVPPEGQNRGYYRNPRVDELIVQGRSTFDREKRRESYAELQRILAEDLPYISLYNQINVAVMRFNVDGFRMDPWGFLLSVPQIRIE